MFLLDELPSDDMLKSFNSRYAEMDLATTAASLRILKTASTLLQELEKHFTTHNLSQARFLALIILEREPSKQQTPAQISRKMGVSKKNTARLLSRMKQDGLIAINDHETDKRASLASISAKGAEQLTHAMPGYFNILNNKMKNLDQSEKSIMTALLDKLLS